MPAHVAFGQALDGSLQIMAGQPNSSELVADSGTSTAVAQTHDIALVTATSDVYVAFGTAPTASATNGFMLPSGQLMAFGRLQAGWKISVVAV